MQPENITEALSEASEALTFAAARLAEVADALAEAEPAESKVELEARFLRDGRRELATIFNEIEGPGPHPVRGKPRKSGPGSV